ncbi:hypothetical protein ACWGKU_28845 [Kitasatospora sp. NPDC054768]
MGKTEKGRATSLGILWVMVRGRGSSVEPNPNVPLMYSVKPPAAARRCGLLLDGLRGGELRRALTLEPALDGALGDAEVLGELLGGALGALEQEAHPGLDRLRDRAGALGTLQALVDLPAHPDPSRPPRSAATAGGHRWLGGFTGATGGQSMGLFASA